MHISIEGLGVGSARRWLRLAGLRPPGPWTFSPAVRSPVILVRREIPRDALGIFHVGGAALSLSDDGTPDTLWIPRGALEPDGAIALAVLIGRRLSERGYLLVHAAAFAVCDRQIVAVGQGGSGKSTLSAVALLSGGKVLSDDAVLARSDDQDGIAMLPYRREISLRPGSAVLLAMARPELRVRVQAHIDRHVVNPNENPEAFLSAIRPTDVWAVSVGSASRSSVKRVTESQMLAALALETPWLPAFARAPSAGRQSTELLAGLVRHRRCFSVSLGTRLLRAPREEFHNLLQLTI